MKQNLRKRLACLLLSALLLIGCLPVTALAAENGFILVAEAGVKLVIAPEYVSYTAGQTAAQALSASGHTFTGLDTGMISAIDGVTGNLPAATRTAITICPSAHHPLAICASARIWTASPATD